MIKVYEKKQTMVDSIQWNGDNYVEVTKFIIKYAKKPIQYFTHCGFDTFTINFQSKDVRVVNSGDYIVIENDEVLVVPEDVFKKNYKCVDDESEINVWAIQKMSADLIKLLESKKQEYVIKNII